MEEMKEMSHQMEMSLAALLPSTSWESGPTGVPEGIIQGCKNHYDGFVNLTTIGALEENAKV
jgi:hypothetical protein